MPLRTQFLILCMLIPLVGIISACTQDSTEDIFIDTGEIGVVMDKQTGDLLDPIGPGTHKINVDDYSVTIYNSRRQSAYEPDEQTISARTQDGIAVEVTLVVIYQIDPAYVNEIHQNWGPDYQERYILPEMRYAVQAAVPTYDADPIYGEGRDGLHFDLLHTLTEALGENHFVVVESQLRDIAFDDKYTLAIEMREIAEMQLETSEIQQQRLDSEAQRRIDAMLRIAEAKAQVRCILNNLTPENCE